MYYLRVRTEDGHEDNVSCYSYHIQPRDGWSFVTAVVRDNGSQFEVNFCVGEDQDWKVHSYF